MASEMCTMTKTVTLYMEQFCNYLPVFNLEIYFCLMHKSKTIQATDLKQIKIKRSIEICIEKWFSVAILLFIKKNALGQYIKKCFKNLVKREVLIPI
jgi:hypothetical protein